MKRETAEQAIPRESIGRVKSARYAVSRFERRRQSDSATVTVKGNSWNGTRSASTV